jgi:hypothetical protein
MGMYHSTYFAYGIRIPDTDGEVLEEALKDQPENARVGYLHAGDYDRDMTFLVTECKEAELGGFETVTPESFTRYERTAWDTALREAAAKLGVTEIPEPGWLIVPDLS